MAWRQLPGGDEWMFVRPKEKIVYSVEMSTAPVRQSTSSDDRVRLAWIVPMAVCFGLLGGLLEAVIGIIKANLAHDQLGRFQAHLTYIVTPLVELIFLCSVGLVLAILTRLLPRLFSWRMVVFCLATVAIGIPFTMLAEQLHIVSTFLLVVGLGAVVARLASRYPVGFRRQILRLLVVTIGAWLVLVGRDQWRIWRAERDALAQIRAQPVLPTPNVLVVVLDTVRSQSVGLNRHVYGNNRQTTLRIEQFAAGGVVFDHALADSPWTTPTHASLFTGRHPHEHGADFQSPLDGRYPTLAESLSRYGYLTAGFVANVYKAGSHTGLARGFARYEDFTFSHNAFWKASCLWGPVKRTLTWLGLGDMIYTRRTAEEINRSALRWLDSVADPKRPFFMFVNYFDAHAPYHVTDDAFEKYYDPTVAEKYRRTIWRDNTKTDNRELIKLRLDTYEALVYYLDHYVGQLLDQLERRGKLNNTLVVITSDHGEQFGEHGYFGHSNSLFRQVIDVPLVMVLPGKIPGGGRRITVPVGLCDVPSTVLDVLGLDNALGVGGRTLVHCWDERSKDGGSVPVLCEVGTAVRQPDWQNANGPVKSVVADGLHYIRVYAENKELLFDFQADPEEQHDLAALPEARERLVRMRALLDELAPPDTRHMQGTNSRAE